MSDSATQTSTPASQMGENCSLISTHTNLDSQQPKKGNYTVWVSFTSSPAPYSNLVPGPMPTRAGRAVSMCCVNIGESPRLPGSTFYSSAVQTLVEPELLARGYAGVLRVFRTKSISREKETTEVTKTLQGKARGCALARWCFLAPRWTERRGKRSLPHAAP